MSYLQGLILPAKRHPTPGRLISVAPHSTPVMYKGHIIHDLDPLTEEFIPESILHRMSQRELIEDTLAPLLKGYKPRPLLLFGAAGAGKTSLATDIAEDLADESGTLKVAYVNCWVDYSKFRVLYSIVQQIASPLLIHRKGTPTDELVERLEHALKTCRCLVILDEVDQLKDKDALYVLARPSVGLIFIADTEGALLDASMRTRSRLGSLRTIGFKAYSVDQLVSILEDRVKHALYPQAISQEQLRSIAISANGDARRAIETLRFASEDAQRNDRDSIGDDDIKQAIPHARKASDERGISKLNMHQRVLYAIIQEAKSISSADLYHRYYEQIHDPVRVRTLRDYLQKMTFYGFVHARGTGRWRTYSLSE